MSLRSDAADLDGGVKVFEGWRHRSSIDSSQGGEGMDVDGEGGTGPFDFVVFGMRRSGEEGGEVGNGVEDVGEGEDDLSWGGR